MFKKIIKKIKYWLNIPNYVIGYDPATKDGDYTCMVHGKYYPRTGVYKIIKTEEPMTLYQQLTDREGRGRK